LTRMGLAKIGAVQELGYKVFADAKIVEVPRKVMDLAYLHLIHRPWMLNVMAGICSTGNMVALDPNEVDALKRFADACLASGTLPCAVTVLTSKTPPMVATEFNGRTPDEQVLTYVEMLLGAGFTDIVCSPLEAEAIHAESRFDGMSLNTPGIRLPGSSMDDQARVDTPFAAIAAGANRLVIGSDLTKGNFSENFARVAANLNGK